MATVMTPPIQRWMEASWVVVLIAASLVLDRWTGAVRTSRWAVAVSAVATVAGWWTALQISRWTLWWVPSLVCVGVSAGVLIAVDRERPLQILARKVLSLVGAALVAMVVVTWMAWICGSVFEAVPLEILARNPSGIFVGTVCGVVAFLAVSLVMDLRLKAVTGSGRADRVSLGANFPAILLAGGVFEWSRRPGWAGLLLWVVATGIIVALERTPLLRVAGRKLISLAAAVAAAFATATAVFLFWRSPY